jgi:hypothetical protein
MSEIIRQRDVQKAARVYNALFYHNQFKRLIENKLKSDEEFETVYKEQLKYQESLEDYEKCTKLLKLKNETI